MRAMLSGMTMAARWTLYGGLGGLAGLLAYFLSLPFFPFKTLRQIVGPAPTTADGIAEYSARLNARPPLTTLGTAYGNIAYALLGGLIAAFLVGALRTERNGFRSGLAWGLLAFPVGAFVGRGADALSDVMVISSGGLTGILWSPLVAGGIALTIGVFQGPTPAIMRRAVVAGLLGALAAHMIRGTLRPFLSIASGGFDLTSGSLDPLARRIAEQDVNLWESERVRFAFQYMSMGFAIGIGFAFAESYLRRATLRWEVGRNEGRSWELMKGALAIGSAEGATIRLAGVPGVLPHHASLVGHEKAYALHSVLGSVAHLNGVAVPPGQPVWLAHGDRIGIGGATLVFAEANRPKVPLAPAAAARMVASAHGLEHIDGRRVELPPGTTILGREPGCGVVLPQATVSRRHAEIRVEGERAFVGDLGSTSGTRVGGAPVAAPRELRDGDVLDLGPARLIYRKSAP